MLLYYTFKYIKILLNFYILDIFIFLKSNILIIKSTWMFQEVRRTLEKLT